jgi:hypothetical protein
MPAKQTGTFLGALWRDNKALGDEVFLTTLERMVVERPAEPEAWLKAAFKAAGGSASRQQQVETRNRSLVADRAANRTGDPAHETG